MYQKYFYTAKGMIKVCKKKNPHLSISKFVCVTLKWFFAFNSNAHLTALNSVFITLEHSI